MFPHSYTSSHIHPWIFKTLQVIISWVWVILEILYYRHGWVGHAGILWGESYKSGWIMQKKQPKNDRPWNQDLTPPNSFFGMSKDERFIKYIHSYTFPYSYTSPLIHSWIIKTLQVIISWVWVICKRLNVNWKKFTL